MSASTQLPIVLVGDKPAQSIVATPTEELAVILGQSFEAGIIFTLATNGEKYISFEVSAGAPTIELQTRIFKADLPTVDLQILWGVGITGGTTIPIFNNRRSTTITSVVSFKEDPTVDLTNAILREEDFIPAGTNNNKSSGQIGNNNAHRLYAPLETFVVKITNKNQKVNRIKLGYAWLETIL